VEGKIDNYYRQHGAMVFYYLRRFTGNSDLAEELTQETFYQAMRTVDKYRGDCKPSVWLCQIAKHVWYQYLEKNRKIIESSWDEYEEQLPGDENINKQYWERQDKIELYKRIQTLGKEIKDVVYLRLSGELSFAEIGEIMGKQIYIFNKQDNGKCDNTYTD
jgi:RNA polymerase sigma-70 factor (ECF subfamily)